MALSFVPVHDVTDAYNELIITEFYQDNEEQLESFISYFKHMWVGVRSYTGRRRRKPYFELTLWNCYEAVINDENRSNNAIEGWHNSFNLKVRVHHATISKFVGVLQDEQGLTEVLITRYNTGLNISTNRRRVYIDIDSRIKNVVLNYDPQNKLNYLKNIASLLNI